MADNLNKKIAIGYLWNLLAKWLTRSIGIISTLILIRLLKPEDFGIATLATIVMALFLMLSEVGVEKYIIKAKECSDELLNSAWSLNITLKVFCAIVIAVSAKSVSEYTHEPVLESVLLLCSLIPVIGAMKNVGLVCYERDLNYKPLTQLSVYVKLLTFPVTIGLALWLRNYWALIAGTLISEMLTVIGSYFIHPYRPRWSVKQWHNQWDFSKWMLVSTTTGYIRSRIDALLLGRFLPTSSVGIYRVSQEFAWLPFSELISPATASFYSGISKISHNRDELNDKIIKYLAIAYLLVIPATFGIYALKDQIVAVVMGEQWISAAPIMGLLSILMLSMPLNMALQTVLINLSKVKYLVLIDLVMILSIGMSFTILHQQKIESLEVYTLVRVMLISLFICLLFATYKLLLGIDLKRLLIVCMMPVLPAAIMFLVIQYIELIVYFPLLVNLIVLVFVGISIFTSLMFLLILSVKNTSQDYHYIYQMIVNILNGVRNKIASR